ncbi:mucolipin-3-like [Amphibalanus amphitrite]|uniref:mucolipin-3-like n=1 Tax=Amphibalanus amphitrite TaxID=1232801 RepID=UPI001C929F3D|nr:mucolipin-3-like [Amphibalanus amphitrite]XP_043240038.1 mucolipin-3-like [Amphibalanus amphitrite]XP_043240045.1 mucolipin-3-like [Amphibalanus amphitrite]
MQATLAHSPCPSPLPGRRLSRSRESLTDAEVSDLLAAGARGPAPRDGCGSSGAASAGLRLNVPQEMTQTPPRSGSERWERINSPDPHQRAAGERTRRKLQFFFMNPLDKWRARRRPPYKLTIQLVKVVLVTLQLTLFASRRFSHVTYLQTSQVSLQHLLVRGWDVSREVNAYPPAIGPLAVYAQADYFAALDFAINAYYDIRNLSTAGVDYPASSGPVSQLCVDEYRVADIRPADMWYRFDEHLQTRCLVVRPAEADLVAHNVSSQRYMREHDFNVSFSSLSETRLSLGLNAVKLKLVMPLDVPDCYYFNVTVTLDNSNQDGQILLSMNVEPSLRRCDGDVEFRTDDTEIEVLFTLVNVLVIVVCAVSLVMCVRALYRAQLLRQETDQVMRKFFDYSLTTEEHLRFLNLWYVLIIINDGLIILASLMKIQLENKFGDYQVDAGTWNVCSVMLGIGNLLVWVGVLRYLGFFSAYNVLILTVRKSLPSVLRFSVCALICYAGFLFCGWLILNPYNMKFRTLSLTSETLFSLMNGDDMFATFAQTSRRSMLVYWFSKFYVYVFVFFFIYLVLSLMISIIMDSYETIKTYYQEGFPQTPLDEFMQVRRHDPATGVYRQDEDELLLFRLLTFWSGCCKPDPSGLVGPPADSSPLTDSETTPLLRSAAAVPA